MTYLSVYSAEVDLWATAASLLAQVESTDYDVEGGSLRVKGVCSSQNKFVTVRGPKLVSIFFCHAATHSFSDGILSLD